MWVLISLNLIMAAGLAPGQSSTTSGFAGVDEVVHQVLARTSVPSASIAIVKSGRIAYVHAYGNSRLEPPTPARPEMSYSIGSK